MTSTQNINTGYNANNQGAVGQARGKGNPSLKLFIGGVPKFVGDDEYREYFQSFGELDDCILMRDMEGIGRGFGFVTFKTQEGYDKVLAAQLWLRGKQLEQKKALPPTDIGQKEGGVKVFLGGLSSEVDKEKIREYFSYYGEVVDAVVMRDSATGNPRGFGFVTFGDPASVDELMKTPRFDFCGKSIQVKRAQSAAALNRLNRNTFGPSGGFRGGFRGRGMVNANGFGRAQWQPPYGGGGAYDPRAMAGRFQPY